MLLSIKFITDIHYYPFIVWSKEFELIFTSLKQKVYIIVILT